MIWYKDISLKLWADTIVRDFMSDNVPMLDDEENWREWGNRLVEEPSFAKAGCPPTDGFDNHESWAQAVCAAMADFS
jgi:hypothetical protein